MPYWLTGFSHCREAFLAWLPKQPWNKTKITTIIINPFYSNYVAYWIQGFRGLLVKPAASATELLETLFWHQGPQLQPRPDQRVWAGFFLAGILPGKERNWNWLEKVKNCLANQTLLLLPFGCMLPADIFAFCILKCGFPSYAPKQFWERDFFVVVVFPRYPITKSLFFLLFTYFQVFWYKGCPRKKRGIWKEWCSSVCVSGYKSKPALWL